jgi:hypothetical protein
VPLNLFRRAEPREAWWKAQRRKPSQGAAGRKPTVTGPWPAQRPPSELGEDQLLCCAPAASAAASVSRSGLALKSEE